MPPFPTTASEIEAALEAPKYRGFGGKWRGLEGIVEDPAEPPSSFDPDSYTTLFQDLPKAAQTQRGPGGHVTDGSSSFAWAV